MGEDIGIHHQKQIKGLVGQPLRGWRVGTQSALRDSGLCWTTTSWLDFLIWIGTVVAGFSHLDWNPECASRLWALLDNHFVVI